MLSPAAPPEKEPRRRALAELLLTAAVLLLLVSVAINSLCILRLREDLEKLQEAAGRRRESGERGETQTIRIKRDISFDEDIQHDSLPTTNIPILKRYINSASFRSADYSNEQTFNSNDDFTLIRNGYRRDLIRTKPRRYEAAEEHVGRIKVLPSAHFSGDTSRYDVQKHDNFLGNGHLKHPRKTFVDWKPTDWVNQAGMDNYFTLDDGILTIKESGLYFVYAQIYYLDEHDRNGFKVFKNNATVLQCTITAHSSERRMKGNTCYTAGAEYLNEGDGIELRDLSEGRYSVFEPGMSFFGLIRLGDVKIK